MLQKMYHLRMLRRCCVCGTALLVVLMSLVTMSARQSSAGAQAQPATRPGGGTLPPGADPEKNPPNGDAAAGEETAGRANAEVRQHAHRQRDPNGGTMRHDEERQNWNEGANGCRGA